MTTAVLLGLTLVFEPKEAGLMSRPPRKTTQPILTRPLLFRVAWVSLLMTAGGFALFIWEKQDGTAIETARTVVVNVIVMVEVFYLLNCRSLTRSFFSLGFFTNRWLLAGVAAMLGAQLLFTYAPIMNRLFHSAPISGTAWLMILAVGSVVFLIIEITKWMSARRRQSRGEVPEAGISVHPNWSGRES
jgi:magnesium-transporting ATPase (P-type)